MPSIPIPTPPCSNKLSEITTPTQGRASTATFSREPPLWTSSPKTFFSTLTSTSTPSMTPPNCSTKCPSSTPPLSSPWPMASPVLANFITPFTCSSGTPLRNSTTCLVSYKLGSLLLATWVRSFINQSNKRKGIPQTQKTKLLFCSALGFTCFFHLCYLCEISLIC